MALDLTKVKNQGGLKTMLNEHKGNTPQSRASQNPNLTNDNQAYNSGIDSDPEPSKSAELKTFVEAQIESLLMREVQLMIEQKQQSTAVVQKSQN